MPNGGLSAKSQLNGELRARAVTAAPDAGLDASLAGGSSTAGWSIASWASRFVRSASGMSCFCSARLTLSSPRRSGLFELRTAIGICRLGFGQFARADGRFLAARALAAYCRAAACGRSDRVSRYTADYIYKPGILVP